MQLLKLIIFSILTVSTTVIKAQQIQWEADRPLTWKDFKGKPGRASAATSSSIVYDYNAQTIDSVTYFITFNFKCVFNAEWSYVKSREHQSPDLLAHEQTHFDITELYTRKLAAAFHAATFTRNYKVEIEDIYKKNAEENRLMVVRYDKEVYRSMNMQLRWQLYIYLQLKALPRNY
ncbi:MAG: hypothetical protein V4560_09810 [Bacteroidota bacterium]